MGIKHSCHGPGAKKKMGPSQTKDTLSDPKIGHLLDAIRDYSRNTSNPKPSAGGGEYTSLNVALNMNIRRQWSV